MAKRSTLSDKDAEGNAKLLEWIEAALGPIYDGDVMSISEYVVALLTTDSDAIDRKESLKEKMSELLDENTSQFVEDLFQVIQGRSCIYYSTWISFL